LVALTQEGRKHSLWENGRVTIQWSLRNDGDGNDSKMMDDPTIVQRHKTSAFFKVESIDG